MCVSEGHDIHVVTLEPSKAARAYLRIARWAFSIDQSTLGCNPGCSLYRTLCVPEFIARSPDIAAGTSVNEGSLNGY